MKVIYTNEEFKLAILKTREKNIVLFTFLLGSHRVHEIKLGILDLEGIFTEKIVGRALELFREGIEYNIFQKPKFNKKGEALKYMIDDNTELTIKGDKTVYINNKLL
jgi:hypothetical protein